MNEEIEASYVLFICILPAIGLWHVKNERESQDKIEMKETKVSTGKQGTGTRNEIKQEPVDC